ncbi:menaquinone biosynthetic enzyme MqnA/MqnD family protein [Hufsiella ginkgonis]|uniref:Chorismate dehydratase n=1 Tax=Hufsiella ginkgonis TaxID=2695274 RepID=A0A7K1XZE7_9SPHI|nr:radical SAM protein [Hufsiella ginkgonis]
MNKIRISAVSYTNTRPFVYGLMHSEIPQKTELTLDVPAECARKLIRDEADIGLVPVAALLHIPGYQIVADYCIGAEGPVNSVFLFSHKPVSEVRTVCADSQSRTSNNLAKVLLKHHWKVTPEFVTDQDQDADAFVLIGDRTFGKKDQYPFAYDLAEEWISFTGLPFVFAVWASNKPIPQEFSDELNAALAYGLDHRREVLAELQPRNDFDLTDYLMNRISFGLDERKREALELFLKYVANG